MPAAAVAMVSMVGLSVFPNWRAGVSLNHFEERPGAGGADATDRRDAALGEPRCLLRDEGSWANPVTWVEDNDVELGDEMLGTDTDDDDDVKLVCCDNRR